MEVDEGVVEGWPISKGHHRLLRGGGGVSLRVEGTPLMGRNGSLVDEGTPLDEGRLAIESLQYYSLIVIIRTLVKGIMATHKDN